MILKETVTTTTTHHKGINQYVTHGKFLQSAEGHDGTAHLAHVHLISNTIIISTVVAC